MKRVHFEERYDSRRKVLESTHRVPVHVLAVVVPPDVDGETTAPEELLQVSQHLRAPSSLDDGELRLDLPTESTPIVAKNRNAETAFAVDEADDPLARYWPFLLIVRTGHIFTSATPYKRGVTAVAPDTRGSQHIANCSHRDHSRDGQTQSTFWAFYLSTVIVTAAVYWRLSSQLRPEGLTGPLNVPAPGRRQSVYIVLRLRTDLCF